MGIKITSLAGIAAGVLSASLLFTGCGANDGVLRSGKESTVPPVVEKIDPFEQDLTDVKGANFTWLYVIRRRDGDILNGEDKAKIRAGTADANRRVVSDGGKAVIVGSNFEASVAGAEILRKTFDVTDLSTGKPAADANTEQR